MARRVETPADGGQHIAERERIGTDQRRGKDEGDQQQREAAEQREPRAARDRKGGMVGLWS